MMSNGSGTKRSSTIIGKHHRKMLAPSRENLSSGFREGIHFVGSEQERNCVRMYS